VIRLEELSLTTRRIISVIKRWGRSTTHDCLLDQTVACPGSGIDHSRPVVNAFGFCRDPLFLIGCTAYALNRVVLKPHYRSTFLHSYFNDLWLIPCALPPLLLVHWRMALRSDAPPTWAEVAGHLAIWSALFEWWGPKIWPRATGDVRDVICYWAGGVAAWLWWNRASLVRKATGRGL
jgi:hypothetical protein